MKLLTKDLVSKLPKLYATDGVPNEKRVVHVKWFDPCGRGTWYVLEYDPEEELAFCWCVSPLGADCDELGYVSVPELASVRNRLGLGIERDLYWTPKTLAEVLAGAR